MAKRGRPALTVPDVGPMNALDVFLTFKKKGIGTSHAASAAMYAVVANQVGWENLGLSRTRVYIVRKMFIDFGINPDRIETVPLSEKYQKELAAAMKEQGDEGTQKEFRQATGIPEPEKLEVEPAPLKFVEPGPVLVKK
jgi:hypothetical protein